MGYDYERDGSPGFGPQGDYGPPPGPYATYGSAGQYGGASAPNTNYDGYGGFSGYGAPGGYADPANYDLEEYDDSSHPAVHWGLVFGIVLTAASLAPFVLFIVQYPEYASNPVFGMLTVIDTNDGAALAPFVLLLLLSGLVWLVSEFLAGFLTTRETGTLRSGTFAGVLAALASNTISTLVLLVWLALQRHTSSNENVSPVLQIFAGIGGLMDFCCGLVGVIVPAAAVAVLGAGLARLIWGPAEG